eukprot:2683116-Pyramimonas_sp.AAC.1
MREFLEGQAAAGVLAAETEGLLYTSKNVNPVSLSIDSRNMCTAGKADTFHSRNPDSNRQAEVRNIRLSKSTR